MANITQDVYKQYEEFAKNKGFQNVSEAVSKLGSYQFKKLFSSSDEAKKINSQKITIELIDGKWLVNKKPFQDCSDWEKDFMNQFFHEIRIEMLEVA